MKLLEVLSLDILESTRVVAGAAGLEREVRWVHISDIPDILLWVQPGQLLLTTGYAWPRKEDSHRSLVCTLAERNIAEIDRCGFQAVLEKAIFEALTGFAMRKKGILEPNYMDPVASGKVPFSI